MKIYLKTFGCSANFAEGEMMQGMLNKHFTLVSSVMDAEVIVLNLCTVKGENNAVKEVRKVHEEISKTPYKKLIVAGCVTKELITKLKELDATISVISTHNISHILEIVEETINDNPVMMLTVKQEEKINLPRVKSNKVVGIVLASQGCKSRCAYCSVVLIKGLLKSYLIEQIKQEVSRFVREGAKEIWLTGQDMGCYGEDIGTNLPALLRELVSVKGDFKIRVGMAHPKHVKNYVDELIDIYKHEKIFKFLHLPVQSGNNEILKKMLRMHTIEEFKEITRKFKEAIPDITLATDVIVGFPTETEEQFQDTVKLIEEIKFDIVHISRFMRRAGTLSDKLEQVDGGTIKDRSRKITTIFDWQAFDRHKKWVGWVGDVIIEEHGKNNTSIGRNDSYKPIVLPVRYKLGAKVKIKVTAYTAFHLRGEMNIEN